MAIYNTCSLSTPRGFNPGYPLLDGSLFFPLIGYLGLLPKSWSHPPDSDDFLTPPQQGQPFGIIIVCEVLEKQVALIHTSSISIPNMTGPWVHDGTHCLGRRLTSVKAGASFQSLQRRVHSPLAGAVRVTLDDNSRIVG